MLEGAVFTLWTDHRPLVQALMKLSEPWLARQARQLSYIAEFNVEPEYLPGLNNPVADCLSRAVHTINMTPLPAGCPSIQEFASEQEKCADVHALKLSDVLRVTHTLVGKKQLWIDVSQGTSRILVPTSLKLRVIQAAHELSHPGVRGTLRLLRLGFVWSGMHHDMKEAVNNCVECHKAKVDRHLHPPLGEVPVPSRRFSTIHVDLVGPLLPSGGCRWLLTLMDRSSRWMEAVPLADTSASSVAKELEWSWISRYGCPSHLISNRGVQFTSQLWDQLSQLLGYTVYPTTAYNPRANEMVERFHRLLKDRL